MSLQLTFDQARLGNVYHAANQAVVTLSGLSLTQTGLALINPPGNTRNFHLLNVSWFSNVAPGGGFNVGLASTVAPINTAPPTTNAVTIYAANLGKGAGQSRALATSGATLVGSTPVMVRVLAGGTASSVGQQGGSYDIDGGIILPPGMSLSLAFITTADTGMGSMTWVELPM